MLGAVTLGVYLFVYTPLKRVTWLNTAVGAVPGALPPLMGWVAARGSLDGGGWLLFGILALWQIPHFLAIAWMYREDYAGAGYAMLPAYDPTGRRTARQALGCALVLAGLSVMPAVWGMAGWLYGRGRWYWGGVCGLAGRFAAEVTEGGREDCFTDRLCIYRRCWGCWRWTRVDLRDGGRNLRALHSRLTDVFPLAGF
jgi:heme O synthase-like polyprenyltransferase